MVVKKKKRGRSVSFDETVTVLDRRGRTTQFPLAPGDGTAASASLSPLLPVLRSMECNN